MARNKKEHAISGTRWDHWDDHLALQIAIVDTLARSTKPMTKREIVQKLRKTDEAPIGGLTMLLEKQNLVIRERKTGYGNTWFYSLTALGKTAAHDHSMIGKAPTTAGSVSKTGTSGANKHVGIAAEGQSEPHPSVAEDLVADMNELLDRNIDSTTKEALINARVGQGRFRSDWIETIHALQQPPLPGQMQLRLDGAVVATQAFGHVFRPHRIHAIEHLAHQFRHLLRQRLPPFQMRFGEFNHVAPSR